MVKVADDTGISIVDINRVYEQLSINLDVSLDIEKLAREYRETCALIEKDDFSTYAFAADSNS